MSSAKGLINLLNSRCYCLRVKMYSTVMNRENGNFTFLWLTQLLVVDLQSGTSTTSRKRVKTQNVIRNYCGKT